jgi:hypothetical protein
MTRMTWGFSALVLLAVVIFSGCTGQDGKVYLSVTSDYYGYCVADSGIGFPETWSWNTSYEVNPGTWAIIYNLATTNGTNIGYYNGYSYSYKAYTNSSNSKDSLMIIYANSPLSASSICYSAAKQVVKDGYYLGVSFKLEKEKGAFLKDGQDRDYVLDLAWNGGGDSTISYNGVPMTKTVLANTEDKVVLQFDSDYDRITLSFDKNAAVPSGGLHANKAPDASVNSVQVSPLNAK